MKSQADELVDLLQQAAAKTATMPSYDDLTARIKRMEEALRHYSCTSETCDCAPVGLDRDSMYCGYRARAALEGKPDEK